MKKNNGLRAFLIIVLVALLIIGGLSIYRCATSAVSVNTSELQAVVNVVKTKEGEATTPSSNYNTFTKQDLKNNGATGIYNTFGNCNDTDTLKINSVSFDVYVCTFTIKCESKNTTYTFQTNIFRTSDEVKEIETVLSLANVPYATSNPNSGSIWSSLLPILGMVLVAVVFFILMMQTQGGTKGAMSFAKTNAKISNSKVKFNDVAGAEEEKEELQEVVEFLKNPKKFSDLGARIPKGVLLVGPPGTGKTLFAKAVAGEAGVPFFSISGSDFVEMFVGVGASRVRDLFETAKRSMPCIVFIDEIDAVGRQRGAGLGGGNDEREQTLNQLLVQMDGFESNDGIIIMAATNRADVLDPALLRPGRFDRQIYVNLPDVRGREAVLKVHARNKPLDPSVNFKIVARLTAGFSGADLENLLNEAAILAARANRKYINNVDLYEGINKVLMGPKKKSRLVTETDKRITAYHESGHAVLAKLLKHCDPVQEVTIIPRGQAAGYTMTRPDNDDNHLTKAKLLDDIVMSLGGRVAEELIIKDISAGASGDIQAVTKRARLMVTEWGMSEKVGPINYGSDKEVFLGKDMASHVSYSEETAGIIDEEVQKIVKDALAKARELLGANKKLLDTMARVLIERETIFTEEVDMIMEGKTPEEIFKFMDEEEKKLSENPFERRKILEAEKLEKQANKTIISPSSNGDVTEEKEVVDEKIVKEEKTEIKKETKESKTTTKKPTTKKKVTTKKTTKKDTKKEDKE